MDGCAENEWEEMLGVDGGEVLRGDEKKCLKNMAGSGNVDRSMWGEDGRKCGEEWKEGVGRRWKEKWGGHGKKCEGK